jgi:hypothetical protein
LHNYRLEGVYHPDQVVDGDIVHIFQGLRRGIREKEGLFIIGLLRLLGIVPASRDDQQEREKAREDTI